MFGSPETILGTNALKFHASMRLNIRRIEKIIIGDKNIGNKIRTKAVKNKVAPSLKQAEFRLIFRGSILR